MPQLKNKNETREQKLARLLGELEPVLDKENGFKSVKERVDVVVNELKDLKESVNPEEVAEEFEKLKAQTETIKKAIKHSKKGVYIPGLEDYGDQFSLLNLSKAVKTGDFTEAGFEQEVMKETGEARIKQLEALKNSDQLSDAAKKNVGQAVGDLARGGAFVPDQLIPDVIESIYTTSVFFAMDGDGQTRVSLIDGITGLSATMPEFKGGMVSYWMGEEDDYAMSQVKTGNMKIEMHKLGALGRMTEEMMRYGAMGFENLFRRDLVKAIVKNVDYTIPFGAGTDHQPRGIARWNSGGHEEGEVGTNGEVYGKGIKVYHAGGAEGEKLLTYAEAVALSNGAGFSGGELNFDQLEEMRLLLEEDDIDIEGRSSATVSCPRYFRRLKTQKIDNFAGQASNRPFLVGIPHLPDSRLAELIGEFGKLNQMRSSATPGSGGAKTPVFAGANQDEKYSGVFMGDMSEMMVARGPGLEIMDDGGMTQFANDSTLVKARMYMGQGLRQPRAIVFAPDVRVRD